MKIRLIHLFPILLLGGVAPVSAQADAVSRTINQFYQIDPLGDAEIEVTFQYNASQWAIWKAQYGDHPDIVLRDMRYTMATAVLENFSLQRDDVQRRATGKVKARALARYKGGGQFVIDVTKDMKLVTGENRDWIFSSTSAMNGEIVSQTLRAKLPEGAHDVHLNTGGDFDNLIYTLDLPNAKPKATLTAGISLFALGAILGGASLFIKKRPVTIVVAADPPGNPPPPQPPALPPH